LYSHTVTVPLVFRRSDIGFGRVIVDEDGVTRERLTRRDSIAWHQIRDYRLTIEIRGAKVEALYLVHHVFFNVALIARDAVHGYRGDHRFRLGIELIGDDQRVAFNWRFRGVAMAIAEICRRICGPLAAEPRARRAAEGRVQFGPLILARDSVQWGDRPPLPRDAVEGIELFNSYPVSLRVMAHRKIWPYGRARTADIPNIAAALELARGLGYPVRGLELFAGVFGEPAAVSSIERG
jgi:hypothetical protein